MRREIFILWYRLDKKDRYLLWISGENDVVYVKNERIPSFASVTALLKFASSQGLVIEEEEPVLHDLDKVEAWIEVIEQPIDCKELLNAWNLFTDIANTFDMPFKGSIKDRIRNNIYDKLFYGNNIYSLTPTGEYYVPLWLEKEKIRLAEILVEGLSMLKAKIEEIG